MRAMGKGTVLQIRVSEEDKARWAGAAEAVGEELSRWVRGILNQAADETKGAGSGTNGAGGETNAVPGETKAGNGETGRRTRHPVGMHEEKVVDDEGQVVKIEHVADAGVPIGQLCQRHKRLGCQDARCQG